MVAMMVEVAMVEVAMVKLKELKSRWLRSPVREKNAIVELLGMWLAPSVRMSEGSQFPYAVQVKENERTLNAGTPRTTSINLPERYGRQAA